MRRNNKVVVEEVQNSRVEKNQGKIAQWKKEQEAKRMQKKAEQAVDQAVTSGEKKTLRSSIRRGTDDVLKSAHDKTKDQLERVRNFQKKEKAPKVKLTEYVLIYAENNVPKTFTCKAETLLHAKMQLSSKIQYVPAHIKVHSKTKVEVSK